MPTVLKQHTVNRDQTRFILYTQVIRPSYRLKDVCITRSNMASGNRATRQANNIYSLGSGQVSGALKRRQTKQWSYASLMGTTIPYGRFNMISHSLKRMTMAAAYPNILHILANKKASGSKKKDEVAN